jgi:hypothetical protein
MEEEERRSSFGGALVLKLHEAVDDGCMVAETVGWNGGSKAVGAGKAAACAPLFGP